LDRIPVPEVICLRMTVTVGDAGVASSGADSGGHVSTSARPVYHVNYTHRSRSIDTGYTFSSKHTIRHGPVHNGEVGTHAEFFICMDLTQDDVVPSVRPYDNASCYAFVWSEHKTDSYNGMEPT